MIFYNVQECLVKVDRHGKIVPWLADRWHTSDDRNYTFFLKRGVRFHNGRELRAADVKFVFDRAMNPETTHPYPGYYSAISDIIVKDDYTVTFTLKAPTANFLLNMARQGSVIYPREAVDTLKSAPIGTGRGLANRYALQSLRRYFPDVPLVIDAGIGAPSHAAEAMELGYDAVMINTAVATATDPVRMARAFAGAIEAGRLGYEGGLMPMRDMAEPSTPVAGTPFFELATRR